MQRIACLVIAAFAIAAAWIGPAQADKRVAFVVGTDKYDNLDSTKQLQRAVNDARAVGVAFKALGFEVVAAENLTRGQFNDQFQKFLDKLKAGDTAAIYYAGHGVEIEGLNFLLPRDIPDIKYGRQEQIKRESLSVAELLLDLRSHNPEIALVILDACRDNPLIPDEMRSAGPRSGGLAPLKGEPPKGTFIMYSAGAGESALDRLPGNDPDKLNSIFTRKLVPLLGTKGLALHEMARQLRTDVIALASTVPHSQRPAYYDGVDGKYCLAGCEGAPEAKSKGLEPPASSQRLSEAAEAWGAVKDSSSTADLEAYVTRYKDTFYAELARNRIEELKKQRVASAKTEPTKPAKQTKEARPGLVEQTLGLILPWDKTKTTDEGRMAMLTRRPTVPMTAAEERALTPLDIFMECVGCPEMVVLPAGEFMMGSPESEESHQTNEEPQHKVTIAKPFAIGRFEITFAEWEACARGGGCASNRSLDDAGWGRDRRPAINVSWDDAREYVEWLSKKMGKTYRLLTEAEWEYAARGVTQASLSPTPFSTGAIISTDQANYDGTFAYSTGTKGVYRQKTVEVGSFPGNAFGLHDLHGNVGEWVEDCYKDSYNGAPTNGLGVTSTDCGLRVVRGGSWLNSPQALRSAFRFGVRSDLRSYNFGFRVARTL